MKQYKSLYKENNEYIVYSYINRLLEIRYVRAIKLCECGQWRAVLTEECKSLIVCEPRHTMVLCSLKKWGFKKKKKLHSPQKK